MSSNSHKSYYLPEGLPIPVSEGDQLSKPYWDGLKEGRLLVQQCSHCSTVRFGPEWVCHKCRGFDFTWLDIEPEGIIYSWERVWHPSHPALKEHGPYLVVLVELPSAENIRMVGNLLGDPMQEVVIGAKVKGVFEHHTDTTPAYSLLHWEYA
ncbi:MAG: DNA-binding protein [Alcaligenaceae bacterium]|nr:DNA-binding protein [Alcaligenaceae bacterium]